MVTQNRNRRQTRQTTSWVSKLFKRLIQLFCLMLFISIFPILLLKWINPPTSSFMLQYKATDRQELQFEWVDWSGLSTDLAMAVIASEDQKFESHFGVDLTAVSTALKEYQRGRTLRGASTITQQTAKNLFLWPERSLFRKILELWLSLCMETLLSKQRILEIYLNIAQFGDGIFGSAAASWHYFNVPPQALNPYQAGLLAASLPSPSKLSANTPTKNQRDKAQWILKQIRQLGGADYLRKLDT